MNAEALCRDTAAPPGSNFHYATLFHAGEERRALYALFALRAEIARIGESTADPAVLAMRRSWWAEELARVAARQPRHPVGIELRRLADGMELDLTALVRFVAGDALSPDGPDTNSAAGIWAAAARACDVSGAGAIDAVIRAGALVDAVEALAIGHPSVIGPDIAKRLDELQDELDVAPARLMEAGAARAEFCRILAGLTAALCAELRRDVDAIGRSRIALTPLRKLWIAWRIHRRRGA